MAPPALRPLCAAAFAAATVGACALLTGVPGTSTEALSAPGGRLAGAAPTGPAASPALELQPLEREARPVRLPAAPEGAEEVDPSARYEPRLPWTTDQMEAAARGEAFEGQRFAVTRRVGQYALDPVEPGESELTLLLHDGASGEPVTSRVELWRLDAPENDYFGRGDQHVRDVKVEEGTLSIPQLAEGRYRIVVHAARPVEDLPAFPVLGPHTRGQFLVQLPRRRPVVLALCDTRGEPLQKAQLRSAPNPGRYRSVPAPTWEQRRRMKIHPDVIGLGGGSGGRFGGRYRWRDATRGARGFELGHLIESSRDQRRGLSVAVRTASSAVLSCEVYGDPVEGDGGGEVRMVGVAVDPREVLRNIYLPDGRNATWIRDQVSVRVRALRELRDDPHLWRRVPVTVKVNHPDFEPLELVYEVGDGFGAQYLQDRIL